MTVVVHHGEHGWTVPWRFHEIVDCLDDLPELRPFVPDFELTIDDLAAADDEALQRRPLAPFPKVTLWLLRDGRSLEAFLAHLVAWAAELDRLVTDDGAGDDYVTVLRYIWRVVGEGPAQVVRQRLVELAPAFGEAMPSYDERLIDTGVQKGLQQGLQQGREEGRREGIRVALLAIVRRRFGSVDAAAEERIDAATVEQLQRWLESAIGAARIEDVFVD